MPENSQLMQFVYGFFCLLGIAGIVATFKTIDWLIGQKYVSHHKCENVEVKFIKQ